MFSIIMPSYNSEAHIRDAINSVVRQSFTDWELIIIDDGSVDKTCEIIQSFVSQDNRIVFLTNYLDKGAAGARNCGIRYATNRYIAFLDSDDFWGSSKLFNNAQLLLNSDIKFLYSNYHTIDNRSSYETSRINSTFVAPNRICFDDLLYTCSIGCLTVVYDTHYFGKVCFPFSAKEDFALWLTLLKKVPYAYNSGDISAYYRLTNNSVSSNKYRELVRQVHVLRKFGGAKWYELPIYLASYIYNGIRKYS